MREFAREFYCSKEWRRARIYIFKRDSGLCVKCESVGEIVHHKTPLSPENIDDVNIALGEDNLELLCSSCHVLEHTGSISTDNELMFDEFGNLIERIIKL